MSLEDRLDALESRLALAEDRLAIYELIATYGPAVDSLSPEPLGDLFTADGTYAIGDSSPLVGTEQIRGLLDFDTHQGYLARGSAHVLSMPKVTIEADTAVAIGYSTVFIRSGDAWVVERASANRWELVRTTSGWRVSKRVNRLLDGDEKARLLLR